MASPAALKALLEALSAERERRRRTEQTVADDARARLEAELEAMYQRLIASTTGPPWSPDGDASVAERCALFGRWPPGCMVDPEQEEAELTRWFEERGYIARV